MNETTGDNTARCLTCGYLLHGLPEPVCPECGRAFDPSDETSFTRRPPGWRKRRLIKRGAIALSVAALLFAFVPRGVLNGELSFFCSSCGETTTFYRREIKAWRWLPFRYPSWNWTRHTNATIEGSNVSCAEHNYEAHMAIDFHKGGFINARLGGTQGGEMTLVGKIVTEKLAEEFLRTRVAP